MAKQKFRNFEKQNEDRFVRTAAAVHPCSSFCSCCPFACPSACPPSCLGICQWPWQGSSAWCALSVPNDSQPQFEAASGCPLCHAYSAAELPPAVRDAAKSLAIWLDDVASLFAFVFLLIFYQRFSCSCCSSYCCCCCCGWTYLKTFNSARWVVVSSVGVFWRDSFLIYLSPLSPAEKLLCIVLACCSCCCRLLTNYAWKCCGQHAACRGKRHARQGGGGRGRGRGAVCAPVWGSALRSSELYQLNLYCPQTQKLIFLAAFVYPVVKKRMGRFSHHRAEVLYVKKKKWRIWNAK